MAKPMSKSDLISKLAEENSDKLSRKDVKSVLESLATIGYKELKKAGDVPASRVRQVRGDQEARHQGAEGYQPVHQGTDRVQGQAGPQGAEGPPGQGRQRRGLSGLLVAPRRRRGVRLRFPKSDCKPAHIAGAAIYFGGHGRARASLPGGPPSDGPPRRTALGGGLSGAVDAGRKSDQVASRPHVLVFRDVRAGRGRRSNRLSTTSSTRITRPSVRVIRAPRAGCCRVRRSTRFAAIAGVSTSGSWKRWSAACATRFVPASCWASNTSSNIRS